MGGCGHRECMGHGDYEICGQDGQMGAFECDGCKVMRLEDQITDLMVAANALRCVYATPDRHPDIMDIAVNNLSIACISVSGK